VVGQQELLEHVDLQHTETAAESDLLFGRDALIAEHNNVMVQVRTVNAREILVVDPTDKSRPMISAPTLPGSGRISKAWAVGFAVGTVEVADMRSLPVRQESDFIDIRTAF
jgi:hypothetical protein